MARDEVSIVIRARDMATRVFTRIRAGMARMQKSVLSLKGAMVALGTAFAAGRIGQSLVKAFITQQDAVEGLRASLEQTGKAGGDALRLLTRRAAELQQATTHGDEAIIAATASFSLLATELSAAELAEAQQALIGIADQFTKGDIQNAALLVGKTIGSTTNALTRFGIQVDVTASQSEKLNQILGQSNKFFEVSKAKSKTLGGQIAQLGNAFGDLKETLGEVLVDILGLDTGTGSLKDRIVAFDAKIKQNSTAIAAWGRVALKSVAFVAQAFKTLIRVAFNVGEILGRGLEIVFSRVVGVVLALLEVAIAKPIDFLIVQLNRIPGVDIDFRIGGLGADAFFANVATQTQNLKGDVEDLNDTLGNLANAWTSVAQAADEANRAQGGAVGGGAGGLRRGTTDLQAPARLGPPRAAFRPFVPSFLPKETIDPAIAARQRAAEFNRVLKEQAAAQTDAAHAAEFMAQTTIAAFGMMAAAAVSGSRSMVSTIIGGFGMIAAAIPGVGTIGVAAIGAATGILSAIASRGPAPVRVESYGSSAVNTMRDLSIRDIDLTTIIRQDGAGIWQTQQKLLELTRQDGSIRIIPVSGSNFGVDNG